LGGVGVSPAFERTTAPPTGAPPGRAAVGWQKVVKLPRAVKAAGDRVYDRRI
jgi:hypothetical protein